MLFAFIASILLSISLILPYTITVSFFEAVSIYATTENPIPLLSYVMPFVGVITVIICLFEIALRQKKHKSSLFSAQ